MFLHRWGHFRTALPFRNTAVAGIHMKARMTHLRQKGTRACVPKLAREMAAEHISTHIQSQETR